MQETDDQMPPQDEPHTQEIKAECTSRFLLDQIADKWSVLALSALCERPLRFNELKRRLDGITQKSLTQTLRRLERNGILARRVIPSSQISVEYSITPLGRTLEKPFEAIYLWTINHLPDVVQAQTAFDAREVETLAQAQSN